MSGCQISASAAQSLLANATYSRRTSSRFSSDMDPRSSRLGLQAASATAPRNSAFHAKRHFCLRVKAAVLAGRGAHSHLPGRLAEKQGASAGSALTLAGEPVAAL